MSNGTKTRSSARKGRGVERDQIIEVRGAREHNLRDVHLTIPKNQLVVFTGVSGSGKSSLAFDTLYAEGQRRYIESLSSYARQFMGQLAKPDVDSLTGLAPSISIEQKTGGANPRSTVGTITEIHDYLRVLFARVGKGHCPSCLNLIEAQSREQIVARALAAANKAAALVLAPVVRGQKGEFKDFFDDLSRQGFVRARVDGEVVRLTDRLRLDRQRRHHIDVVVDRLTLEQSNSLRLAEAVEQALKLSDGSVIIAPDEGDELFLSSKYSCPTCQLNFEPPTPQMFSFNSPQGMCVECEGLGERRAFDPDLLVPNPDLSLMDGALKLVGPLKDIGRWRRHLYKGLADHYDFELETAWRFLGETVRHVILHGSGDEIITYKWRTRGRIHYHGEPWTGHIPDQMARYRKLTSPMHRKLLEQYMRVMPCDACRGERLNAQARCVRIGGKTLIELEAMAIDALDAFFADDKALEWSEVEWSIARQAIREIRARLGFLMNVGLHYLSLSRSATTLSGGEAQRIRLASQIGSGLVGVLYILDEPSIGLHPRDNARLLAALGALRDQGNTLIVVEHDEETMRSADYLVDFGPGPGSRGGEIVAQGNLADLSRSSASVTGQFLAGRRKIEIPRERRPIDRAAFKPATISKAPATAPKGKGKRR